MERTWKPTTAGILNIISGGFFLVGGLAMVSLLDTPMATSLASYVIYSIELSGTPDTSFVTRIIMILATALIVPAIISILGGIYAIKRNVWGLALTGSVSTLIFATPLGIPAIILITLSKREFA